MLDDKQREQKIIEDRLKQREAELAERELDLLQRELNVIILQQQPTPKKRKGNFKKSRLKLLKNKDSVANQSSATAMISAPLGKKTPEFLQMTWRVYTLFEHHKKCLMPKIWIIWYG